jgi:hypothetical protein
MVSSFRQPLYYATPMLVADLDQLAPVAEPRSRIRRLAAGPLPGAAGDAETW